jgi:NitT/TauT family transport system ATP-binding protein
VAAVKRLIVEGLAHSFGPAKILQDIDLTVSQGETVAVVGPSGGGKSTLLRLCARLMDAEIGRVSSSFQRQSFAFQDTRLLPWQTALDNIAFGLKALRVSARKRRSLAHDMGLRLGLLATDLAKFPGDLSGGMRQRVSFSRALLTRPDLLFLDEPFSALDIGLKQELQQVLLDDVAERGMAVFFITHDLMEAVRLADCILVLAGNPGQIVGRYVFDQPPSARNAQYINQHTAVLLADPLIIENFSLRVRVG